MSTATGLPRPMLRGGLDHTKQKPVQDKPTTPKRTTVALSARAAEIVESFQQAAGISFNEAVSELIERTEEPPARIKFVDGIPMADVALDGKWITTEDVLRAEAEIW